VYDEALTPKFPLPVEGPIDALDSTASGWLFASYFAPVAGKTSMEVGRINAWNVSTGATVELKVRAAAGQRCSGEVRRAVLGPLCCCGNCTRSGVAPTSSLLSRRPLLVQSPGLEHAHRLQITALDTAELHGRTVLFTGSLDGTIRVWSYDAASAQFQFHNTLEGHIRGAWRQERALRHGYIEPRYPTPLRSLCAARNGFSYPPSAPQYAARLSVTRTTLHRHTPRSLCHLC
jgi:hypothetical protein